MSEQDLDEFWAALETKDVARPVWVTAAPWSIDARMEKQRKALELLFGKDLHIINAHTRFIVYTPGEVCECSTCSTELQRVMDTTPGINLSMQLTGPLNRMILCPECGNKRCPQANHHDNKCTHSNEPGQKGSAYQ